MQQRRVDPIRQATPILGKKRQRLQATYDRLDQQVRHIDRQLRELSARRIALAAKRRDAHRQLFINLAKRGRRAAPDGSEALPPLPHDTTWLWGRRLRSVCRALLAAGGPTDLVTLHARLHRQGYGVAGNNPVKALADALGYETDEGRVCRERRGVYRLVGAA